MNERCKEELKLENVKNTQGVILNDFMIVYDDIVTLEYPTDEDIAMFYISESKLLQL